MPVVGVQLGIVGAISVADGINMAALGLQLIAKGLSPNYECQIIDELVNLAVLVSIPSSHLDLLLPTP